MNIKEIEIDSLDNNEFDELYRCKNFKIEQCILLSDKLEYCITYTPLVDVYDVIIKDLKINKIIFFETRKKLSSSTLKYFNLKKNDTYNDPFNNEFKCVTHYIIV